ncbi:MAG: S-adenosyl-l-methionine hydroxide adenosyltransferase family protein [Candidatus Bipolaricaulota bacterium]|nr:S-adenosyl-l-methionine hydroxide adenosyltransferase family protein [Candidatus Bipolaricaulota bacterium]MCS7274933.1 S-adenosyl-l-methionine hydroxide adenosyltransferase family protein [Candidatus Bipolaricaulota bacterium]MDW8110548.1 S-adenosyl-l-methionine hydroxide adenosyltransferase family protein [Candidatus Bipolaricaulota bacterium]MDW8329818.1 S-adenosyl-l-methionine hydroxide adenosyltransferase family protein [Candidatus Bipolaricaulota bacterium]
MAIITWLSDFGSASGYPAAMKGVALQICPGATFVDLSHDVERHNVREGAFLLWMTAPYFPDGTIHCAVVDPGVGTERRAIIIKTQKHFFVGPDNGLLLPAASRLGDFSVYLIQNTKFFRPEISKTFHGRDIFAPVAAHLANGIPPEEIGPPAEEWVKLSFGQGLRRGDLLEGDVIYIDSFGNAITNIAGELLPKTLKSNLIIETERKSSSARYARTYGDFPPDELIVTVGSHGHVEIAVVRGSAAQRLRLRAGDPIKIHWHE